VSRSLEGCGPAGWKPALHEETVLNETDITPKELAEKLASGESVVMIDVREPYEWSVGHIDAAQHIPLAQVPQRLTDIPKDREIVMICRSGGRSERARMFLEQSGFTNVKNLVGGMMRWAREVDPSMRVA